MSTIIENDVFHIHFTETILEKNLEKAFFNVETFEESAFLDRVVPMVETFLFGEENENLMRNICQQLIGSKFEPDNASKFFIAASEIGIDYIIKLNQPRDMAEKITTVAYRTEKAAALFDKMFYRREYESSQHLFSQYKMAVDASSIVSKTNPHGVITYVNDNFCKLSGYRREELIGKPHNIVRHPEMPKSAFEDLWSTIQRGDIWNGTVKNLRKDGTFYIVNATVVPIRDEREKIVEYISLRRDITEEEHLKKQMENERIKYMKHNMKKMQACVNQEICDAIPFAAAIIDDNDKILCMNDNFGEKTSSSDAYKGTLQELLKLDASMDDYLWKETLQTFGGTIGAQSRHTSLQYRLSLKSRNDDFLIMLIETGNKS